MNGVDNRLVPPVFPGQAAQQDRTPQQESGAKNQGFVLPKWDKSVDLPPLPGLFQSQNLDQAPLPGWLQPQSQETVPWAGSFQPPGEIKMPRGFTKLMRQWAKGWVRNRGIKQAEEKLLAKFTPLSKYPVDGLRSYLAQLKQQVVGQTLEQMEQPGGWTDGMTLSVEVGLQIGKHKKSVINYIKKNKSYQEDMEGADMYVDKLTQEYHNKPEARAPPAQQPADWSEDMTDTVTKQLEKDEHTELEEFQEVLKEIEEFETDDTKGLQRYLEMLKQYVQDEAEEKTQHD